MATPRASNGRRAMAAYLRGVVGRASERLTVPAMIVADPTRSDNQQDDGVPQKGGPADLKDEDKAEEDMDAAAAAIGGGCDTASSTGTLDELVETHEEDEPPFCVRIESSRSEPRDLDAREGRRGPWAYCDVLLQPDAHGLGLNLSVSDVPRGLKSMRDGVSQNNGTVVAVSSFRRLHSEDIGPAEASGEIRSGDILWAIDGERMETLEAVATSASRRTNEFILLRFLRPTNANEWTPVDRYPTIAPAVQDPELRPDVARLIRELVTRNRSLEEQLVASRLKQDEQRIQLDQLHALYAKTQLENGSAFSLQMPFTRRGISTSDASSSSATQALSSAAARLMGSNAMQYDVAFAVEAERERLTRQYDQQLEIQRQDIQAVCDAQLDAVRAAADKKIRMLEHGIQQLLACSMARDAAPVEVSPYVIALRHQVLHRHQRGETDSDRTDCLLCLLENELPEQTDCVEDSDGWRNQVVGILDEYAALKATREQRLKDPIHESELVEGCNETVATETPQDDSEDC